MMRWVKVEDVGRYGVLLKAFDKFRSARRTTGDCNGGTPATGRPAAPGIRRLRFFDGFIHLGGIVPGTDARP